MLMSLTTRQRTATPSSPPSLPSSPPRSPALFQTRLALFLRPCIPRPQQKQSSRQEEEASRFLLACGCFRIPLPAVSDPGPATSSPPAAADQVQAFFLLPSGTGRSDPSALWQWVFFRRFLQGLRTSLLRDSIPPFSRPFLSLTIIWFPLMVGGKGIICFVLEPNLAFVPADQLARRCYAGALGLANG